MKKVYNAPALELLEFISLSPIGATDNEEDWGYDPLGSKPYNNGELGWT